MTKQERMTRARVWRALAEKIDRSGLYASGLCYELRSLRDGFEHVPPALDVSDDIVLDMQDQLDAHVAATCDANEGYGEYLDRPYETDSRILFCLMLAHEAEDEVLP